jgi:hypothetical protein
MGLLSIPMLEGCNGQEKYQMCYQGKGWFRPWTSLLLARYYEKVGS